MRVARRLSGRGKATRRDERKCVGVYLYLSQPLIFLRFARAIVRGVSSVVVKSVYLHSPVSTLTF